MYYKSVNKLTFYCLEFLFSCLFVNSSPYDMSFSQETQVRELATLLHQPEKPVKIRHILD